MKCTDLQHGSPPDAFMTNGLEFRELTFLRENILLVIIKPMISVFNYFSYLSILLSYLSAYMLFCLSIVMFISLLLSDLFSVIHMNICGSVLNKSSNSLSAPVNHLALLKEEMLKGGKERMLVSRWALCSPVHWSISISTSLNYKLVSLWVVCLCSSVCHCIAPIGVVSFFGRDN